MFSVVLLPLPYQRWAEECRQAQECKEKSCTLMYQSCISCGFGESPRGDLLLESQSVFSEDCFSDYGALSFTFFGSAPQPPRKKVPFCQAYVPFLNWKLVNVISSKHLQLWTAHNGECSCIITKVLFSGIAKNLACTRRGLPTGSCSLPSTCVVPQSFHHTSTTNVV